MAGREWIIPSLDECELAGFYKAWKLSAERIPRPPNAGGSKRNRTKAGLIGRQHRGFTLSLARDVSGEAIGKRPRAFVEIS